MTKIVDQHRRRLVGTTALALAAAKLGLTRSASAQSNPSGLPAVKPRTDTSFGPLEQIDLPIVDVAAS
jgi:hypothetical protein